MRRIFLFALCGILFALAAGAQTSAQTQADFDARYQARPCANAAAALQLAKNDAERDALTFLYAYMDLGDVLDCTPEYMIENVRIALRSRAETKWGPKVPDREWRHFVLPLRVNNENLDDFRTETFDELKERTRGMSMHDAALEVNHWCHEYVTYRPSDARTSSPLASMRTGWGRCGEESTLTVAALRTVGIPARQVYTPRWAHTDDNHAWVEAWVDGEWHFLGACEPAADLDIAWFNNPASRGMLMNTTVLGKYDGPEQVLVQRDRQTTINTTEIYAPTARTRVEVLDESGRRVEGASIRFGLYNYAEFYPIYSTKTDEKGGAELVSGKGDMLVWAAKDGKYGFAKVSAGAQSKAWNVVLKYESGAEIEADFDIVPPKGSAVSIKVDPAAEAANNRRLAYEDSLRNARAAKRPTQHNIEEAAEVLGYDYARIRPLFEKSCGNYMALLQTLSELNTDRVLTLGGTTKAEKEFLLDFFETMSDKDLRDFDKDLVLAHFDALRASAAASQPAAKLTPEAYDRFKHYVLSPRISDERLTAWRSLPRERMSATRVADFRQHPRHLEDWLNAEVQTLDEPTSRYINVSPAACLENGYADAFSKGICFVALSRSIGVPARYDAVNSKFQFYQNGWQDVHFDAARAAADAADAAPTANLTLQYDTNRFPSNPNYYVHFTLSSLKNGVPQLLGYPEDYDYAHHFSRPTPVERGDVLLTSGTRLADGSVLAHVSVFPLQTDRTQPLILRSDDSKLAVIGSLNAEDIYFDAAKQQEQSILAQTGRGYYALVLAKGSDEPSNHILRDIAQQRAALEAWGRDILVLFPSDADLAAFEAHRSQFGALPANTHFGVDRDGKIAAEVLAQEFAKTKELPCVLMADTFNRVVFFQQGYAIGTGERISQVAAKLQP